MNRDQSDEADDRIQSAGTSSDAGRRLSPLAARLQKQFPDVPASIITREIEAGRVSGDAETSDDAMLERVQMRLETIQQRCSEG